jgi:hypothetical protein
VRSTVYLLDSKTNNYYTNPAQTSLQVTRTEELDYAPALGIPMSMEQHSVALILLEPAGMQATLDVQPTKISLTKSSQVSVYLYGSASLDVMTVDAATLRLHPNGQGAGAGVMQRTPGVYFTTVRDYDGDGRTDRLVVFSVADLKAAGMSTSTSGFALRGPGMSGVDAVPPTIIP